MFTLFTDGGARNNPGPAGIGWVIYGKIKSQIVASGGEFIGAATNNEAEYRALIRGLEECKKLKIKELECLLDSNLVVNQLNGKFKVKQSHLEIFVIEVKKLESQFNSISYNYIPREKNALADRLVNLAIDKSVH